MDNDLMWKALADPTRRQILDLLAKQPYSTGALADQFPTISRFAVMKHLSVLESARLVTFTRSGKHRLNHFNAVPLRQAYERWVSRLDHSWAGMLTAIESLAEEHQKGSHMSTEIRHVNIHQEHSIRADKDVVWKILTTRIGDWWQVPYRMFRGVSEMSLELKPGGGLVEQQGDDFVYWSLVASVHHGKSLSLHGLAGVQGCIEFALSEEDGITTLTINHTTIDAADPGEPERYSEGWSFLAENLTKIAEAA